MSRDPLTPPPLPSSVPAPPGPSAAPAGDRPLPGDGPADPVPLAPPTFEDEAPPPAAPGGAGEAPVVLREPGRGPGDRGFVSPGAAPEPWGGTARDGHGPGAGRGPVPGGIWASVLAPGERVLWEGAPRGRAGAGGLEILPQLVMLGFAGFWTWQARGDGIAWIFGLLFALVALAGIRRRLADRSARAGRTAYLLTDRAAYMRETDRSGAAQIESVPITRDMRLARQGRSVILARRRLPHRGGTVEVPVGFHDIDRAQEVFDLVAGLRQDRP